MKTDSAYVNERDDTISIMPTHVEKHENMLTQHEISQSDVSKDKVFVKFIIDDLEFLSAFKTTTTALDLKRTLIEAFDLHDFSLVFLKNGIKIDDFLTLEKLGAVPYGKIVLDIYALKGKEDRNSIKRNVLENIPTISVITSHLTDGKESKDIVVEIEDEYLQKEWLGGYQNKVTLTEYHNACTQTEPRFRKVFEYTDRGSRIPLLFHRDTQTPFLPKDVTVDTTVDKATQMWRRDLYITPKNDKIVSPRKYLTYAEWYKSHNNEKAIITIQRAVRNWIRGKRLLSLVRVQKEIIKDMKTQKDIILQEQSDKERAIITGAAYVVKRDDFYMQYLMVGKWWKREWKRICELRSTESKKAESVALLEKEVKLLEAIEKHKIIGKNEALKKERMRFLEQSSKPLTFKNARGQMTSIDDIDTQRAREFKEIYSALIRKDTSSKDRIDVLITLKQLFVQNFMKYEYAEDLISLIEREINLLVMGTNIKSIKGLHTRIEQLYMYFLQQEEFNPKASKYKQPNLPKTINNLFRCTRCQKLLPASKYAVHVRMKSYTECKSCTWMQNIGHQRVDQSPYLKLLKQVQNSEMQKCCYSAVCFILQPIGMGYLTNVIWHGHSAISECSDLSKLQHIRFLPDVEWAPWNTILLTDQEAKCHRSIPDIFSFYDDKFIENVRQKHILARIRFIPLLKMNHDMRSSGEWENITDSGVFLHPSHAERFANENCDDVL